jgi:hypothetical protein
MLKSQQLMRFCFTPSEGEQSFMGAAIARKVSAFEDGCSIDVRGYGTLHGFNLDDLR